MEEELKINKEMFTGSQEDTDAIKIAIEKLSMASQEQFEEIKKEKWYNRVFDMITFSQKGKKRLAEQINTVAQAQQILVELLLRISSENVDISNLVTTSMNDIRRITEQNVFLLSKINHLESMALGIKSDMDIEQLTDKEKQVLCACLYWLNDNYGNTSEEQKKFANAVINYLSVDVQMDNPTEALKNMSNDSSRKILACCMEYIFLENCSFELWDNYEEFIEEFDFGGKTIKELKKQIESLYRLRGCEGFYSKYMTDSYIEIDDIFFFEFDDVVTEGTNDVFDDVALTNLQAIMEKYGIVKSDSDYKRLTKQYYAIIPDAYLGRLPDYEVYFTTSSLYARFDDDTWKGLDYSELNLNEAKLTRKTNELYEVNAAYGYQGTKKQCEDFIELLSELQSAQIAEYDMFNPIWLYEDEDIYLYGMILVDFLKMGGHDTKAALVKVSELLILDTEVDSEVFKQLTNYAQIQQEVTLDELKNKILDIKERFDDIAVKIHMAILYKDLFEILQLATGKVCDLIIIEKKLFDWLAKEAQIEDNDMFMNMIMLPYRLITSSREAALSIDTIKDLDGSDERDDEVHMVEKYAYESQNYIPYYILDNESIGFWSHIREGGLREDDIAYHKFALSLAIWTLRISGLYSAKNSEKISFELNDYWEKCNIQYCSEALNQANLLIHDETGLIDRYTDDDRRKLGSELLSYFQNQWLKKQEVSGYKEIIEGKGFKNIHGISLVEMQECKGLLVWDSAIWHELSFLDINSRRTMSLDTGGEEKIKQKFNELSKQYRLKLD